MGTGQHTLRLLHRHGLQAQKSGLQLPSIISDELLSNFKLTYPRVDNACLLLTAERDFDPVGYQHTPWDEQVSTILTPAGLPIEGGGSAAISSYTGYTQKTPVDVMVEVPIANFPLDNSGQLHSGKFLTNFTLPQNLPPGIYRLRLDFGFKSGSSRYNFNSDGISNKTQRLKQCFMRFLATYTCKRT